MLVEAFVQTTPRTVLTFLTKSLRDQIALAFRENSKTEVTELVLLDLLEAKFLEIPCYRLKILCSRKHFPC